MKAHLFSQSLFAVFMTLSFAPDAVALATADFEVDAGQVKTISNVDVSNNNLYITYSTRYMEGTLQFDGTNSIGQTSNTVSLSLRDDAFGVTTNQGKVVLLGGASMSIFGTGAFTLETNLGMQLVSGSALNIATTSGTSAIVSRLTVDAGAIVNVSSGSLTFGKQYYLATRKETQTINGTINLSGTGRLSTIGSGGSIITGSGTINMEVANAQVTLAGPNVVNVDLSKYFASMAAAKIEVADGFNFALDFGTGGLDAILLANGIMFAPDEEVRVSFYFGTSAQVAMQGFNVDLGEYGVHIIGLAADDNKAIIRYGSYVPEPTTATLGVLGLAGLLLRRRRATKK